MIAPPPCPRSPHLHLPSPTASGVVSTDHVAELVAIFDETTQVCEYRRPAIPAISHYLDAADTAGLLGRGFRLVTTPGQRPVAPSLPAWPGRDALLDDITQLGELFADLTGCAQLGLRLEVLGQAMCPRFHVDRVGLRLLCSYRGPGTEWLGENGAERSRLGRGANGLPDARSGLIRDPAAIGQAGAFSLLLLKGSLWQGNAGRGAIHRSPATAGTSRRVLLALDAIW